MWLMLIIFIVSLILCILANINYYRSLAVKGEDNAWLLKFNNFIVLSMFASSSIFLENVFNLSEQKFSIQHLLCFAIGFALSYAVKGLTRDACQKKWENKNSNILNWQLLWHSAAFSSGAHSIYGERAKTTEQ